MSFICLEFFKDVTLYFGQSLNLLLDLPDPPISGPIFLPASFLSPAFRPDPPLSSLPKFCLTHYLGLRLFTPSKHCPSPPHPALLTQPSSQHLFGEAIHIQIFLETLQGPGIEIGSEECHGQPDTLKLSAQRHSPSNTISAHPHTAGDSRGCFEFP